MLDQIGEFTVYCLERTIGGQGKREALFLLLQSRPTGMCLGDLCEGLRLHQSPEGDTPHHKRQGEQEEQKRGQVAPALFVGSQNAHFSGFSL